MDDLGIEIEDTKYQAQISDIIQGELIDLYGPNGYKSIMQTMTKISGKTEDIITNFELFSDLSERVFENHQNQKFWIQLK